MADIKIERITASADEIRNGWNDDSLRAYLEKRNEPLADKIDPRSEERRKKKLEQNHRYRPHRWRSY